MVLPDDEFDVIAERALGAVEPGQAPRTVTVRIGRPEPDPEEGCDWRCAVRIDGLGDGGLMYANGVDSAQALLLAFQLAGIRLRYTSDAVTLAWLGGADLGFPLPGPPPDTEEP